MTLWHFHCLSVFVLGLAYVLASHAVCLDSFVIYQVTCWMLQSSLWLDSLLLDLMNQILHTIVRLKSWHML